jgi:hypothetical protein
VISWPWLESIAVPDSTYQAPFFIINGTVENFTSILKEIANTTAITLSMNDWNQFEVKSLRFGEYYPSDLSAYWEDIEITDPTGAVYDTLEVGTINPSYQGMGLPLRFFDLLVSYMK